MAAPTTAFSSGSGTITTTAEGNGLLLSVNTKLQNPRVRFGFSGTFTSVVVAVRGRLNGLTNYYPLRGVNPTTSAVITDSTAISLTDSTNAALEFDASGCDYVEIWVVSGTPTSFTVEERQYASGGPVLNVVNVAVSGTQTYTGASTVNVSSATAFVVGPNGTTNPTFQVVTNVASEATGIKITGAAAAGGCAVAVISSGTNEALTIDAKGSGTIGIGTVSTGAITLGAATGITGAGTITSTSASALTVGANGATNPVLKVNAATSSVATGLSVTGAAAAGGLAVAVISSGTNENLTINAKGSGTVTIGGTSTGNVVLGGGGGIVVVPGTLTGGGLLTCAVQIATSGPLIYSGSGAPSISAAVKGSLYLRSDGSTTSTRAYIATDTSGTWTALTTAA